jgi:hypothetical protein
MVYDEKRRAFFMNGTQHRQMQELVPNEEWPYVDKKHGRSHYNCRAATGVSRPGKTSQDKALGTWSTRSSRHGMKEDMK